MKNMNKILGMVMISTVLLTGVASAEEAAAPECNNLLDVIAAPSDIVAVEDGYLVTDTYNRIIWKIVDGKSEAYAGGFATPDLYGQPMGGYIDTENDSSFFKKPWAITPYLNGYAVSDPANSVIRYVDDEITQTVNGREKIQDLNVEVEWKSPMGLTTDGDGNLYVADAGDGTIHKIDTTGNVTLELEGLEEPTGICWKNDALYIAETAKHRIVKWANGELECVAGTEINGLTDGPVAEAQLTCPQGVEVSDDGIVFIADTGNNAVRMVKDGQVTTLITVEKDSLALYPVEPLGLLATNGQLLVCDAFGRSIYTLEY